MKDVKVLGTGCANCRNTVALIEAGYLSIAEARTVKLSEISTH